MILCLKSLVEAFDAINAKDFHKCRDEAITKNLNVSNSIMSMLYYP